MPPQNEGQTQLANELLMVIASKAMEEHEQEWMNRIGDRGGHLDSDGTLNLQGNHCISACRKCSAHFQNHLTFLGLQSVTMLFDDTVPALLMVRLRGIWLMCNLTTLSLSFNHYDFLDSLKDLPQMVTLKNVTIVFCLPVEDWPEEDMHNDDFDASEYPLPWDWASSWVDAVMPFAYAEHLSFESDSPLDWDSHQGFPKSYHRLLLLASQKCLALQNMTITSTYGRHDIYQKTCLTYHSLALEGKRKWEVVKDEMLDMRSETWILTSSLSSSRYCYGSMTSFHLKARPSQIWALEHYLAEARYHINNTHSVCGCKACDARLFFELYLDQAATDILTAEEWLREWLTADTPSQIAVPLKEPLLPMNEGPSGHFVWA
ncbi:hypothetical protein BKA70DRAFT_1417513 [Coprinopsis sp. MPI-PUGE-AT-0042]|nr:hypothetical protein BKA70DRAFT_1417513 [Coprinopsis sp. MPI-PUGE-AT-0042]